MKDYEVISKLLYFIEQAREGDSSLSFVDIILEFCNVFEIEQQFVQECIQDDVYFKKMLLNDCKSKGIIKSDTEKLGEW